MSDAIRHTERFTYGEDAVVEIPSFNTQVHIRRILFCIARQLTVVRTARANLAPSAETPQGTTRNDWAKKHAHQSVLQQHCDFFDRDHDGVLWPQDTFTGFHRLGFGIVLSLIALVIIYANSSYPTCPGWLPDPFFRFFLKFEDIFEKYANGRSYLTIWDVSNVLKGQRCIADPIGWGGALFEWVATYIMLWPQDGRMMKEDIRGIYDGSIFYTLAARREKSQ
ncbi:Nn.00g105730.m01.CDS01 [Neocucurbitaria sp. VM-36]